MDYFYHNGKRYGFNSESLLPPDTKLAVGGRITYKCCECGGAINNKYMNTTAMPYPRAGCYLTLKFIHPECEAYRDDNSEVSHDETGGLPIGHFFGMLDYEERRAWEQAQLEREWRAYEEEYYGYE